MTRFTEHLLQAAAVIVILYFVWQIAMQAVVSSIVAQGNLRACQQEVLRLRPPAPVPSAPQPSKP